MITVLENREYVRRAFVKVLGSLDACKDTSLVAVDYSPTSCKSGGYQGLSEARKLADLGKRVIVYGWLSAPVMYLSEEFALLFADYTELVRYVRLPSSEEGFVSAFDIQQYPNPALKLVGRARKEERVRHRLIHDIKYEINRSSVLREARECFGFKGSDEEVESQLRELRFENISRGTGLFLHGVFCDVEGTYLQEGIVDENLRKELADYAKSKTVNLWTGGNAKVLAGKVGDAPYPLLSKADLRCAEVEIAIDDISQEEFERTFGIKARQFIKV